MMRDRSSDAPPVPDRLGPKTMNVDTGANRERAAGHSEREGTADEFAADLSLMLMYLSSWKDRPDEALRFWKGFSFDVLNQLAEKDLISDSRRAKSAYLTDAGMQRARELLARYGAADPWAEPGP